MSDPLTSLTPDQAQQLRDHLLFKARLGQAARWGIGGLAGGVGIAGLGLLGKTVSSAVTPNKSSFTKPVDAVVYQPDREKKRSRRGRKAATFELAPPVAKELQKNDIANWAIAGGSLMAGLPVGYMLADKFAGKAFEAARHNELRAAQREFETALQEYAESGDEPRLLEKRAGMSDREFKIAKLAANCEKISKNASVVTDMGKAALLYGALSPLLFGVYGFSDQWSKRKYKDLQLAERQLNAARERTNPTFTVATLRNPPDLDQPVDSDAEKLQRQEEISKSLDEAVDTYQTDYL